MRPNSSVLEQLYNIGTISTNLINATETIGNERITQKVPDWLNDELPERYSEEFKQGRGMNRVQENE